MARSRIDAILDQINKGYQLGLLAWMKRQPDRWNRLLQLESRINQGSLSGDDSLLNDSLFDYLSLFEESLREYQMMDLPLFKKKNLTLPSGDTVTVPIEDVGQIKKGEEVIDMQHHERFPSHYLTQKDFDEPQILTIQSFTEEEVKTDNGPVSKFVLYFEEIEERGFIVNSVNSQLLEKYCGDDSDWIGKQIEVYTDPTIAFGNKVTGGLRVRKPSRPVAQEETP